mgnify:CR=1 FL=1
MAESALLQVALASLDERYAELRIAQPKAEDAMADSMRRFGQISPVVAVPGDQGVILLDGFKRLAAARKLELDELTVRILPLNPRAAVAAIYGLNRSGRGLLDLEEAMVVRKLVRELGLTQPEVGELLGRHKTWVSRRLALVERLAEEVQNDIRVGLIRPTVARDLVRLPRGNQPEVAAAVHQHGLSSREATLLVNLFERASDRKQQRALLDDPRQAIEGHHCKEPPHDARLDATANRIRRQALSLVEGCARLDRLVAESPVPGWSEVQRQILAPLLQRAGDAATRLGQTLASVVEACRAADGRS